MKTGIIGAVALALGLWSLASCWWIVVEVFQGLIALGLIVGGGLVLAVAIRRISRDKQTAKQ